MKETIIDLVCTKITRCQSSPINIVSKMTLIRKGTSKNIEVPLGADELAELAFFNVKDSGFFELVERNVLGIDFDGTFKIPVSDRDFGTYPMIDYIAKRHEIDQWDHLSVSMKDDTVTFHTR